MNIIKQGNYIAVHKGLVRAFGLRETYVLVFLCERYEYCLSAGKLIDNKFTATAEETAKHTGLTTQQQRTAIASLKAQDLISTVRFGLPAKRYFGFNAGFEAAISIILN